ncbi:MAG TPA: hypothetical protein PK323_05245 [Bacteroidia bacterium]|nr:hypothetical protein [Bacteroidia bacterium]
MRKFKFFCTLICVLFFGKIFSQNIPEPDFSSRPYVLAADNTLKNLERVEAQGEVKIAGVGKFDMFYTVFQPKSDVRFSKGALPMFIIKIEGNLDPADVISISIAKVKKDRRKFQLSSYKIGQARDISDTYLKLEFKKIKESIFEIILPDGIKPGEYAFMPIEATDNQNNSTNKVKLMCFAID